MNESAFTYAVAQAIDRVLSGNVGEDSLFEFKGGFPDPADTEAWNKWVVSKSHQFAGLCNAARGNNVFVVFGVDQQNRTLRTCEVPEKWWPQMRARFPRNSGPRHLLDRVVSIEAEGATHHVHAWAFGTDGAPYMLPAVDDQHPDHPQTRLYVP